MTELEKEIDAKNVRSQYVSALAVLVKPRALRELQHQASQGLAVVWLRLLDARELTWFILQATEAEKEQAARVVLSKVEAKHADSAP